MDDVAVELIVNALAERLSAAYGSCGVAMSPKSATLNASDADGNDIVIEVTVKQG